MSPEQQRIAIAEILGWRAKGDPYPSQDDGKTVQWWVFGEYDHEKTTESLPDFLNDLNAMHEAENGLEKQQYFRYIQAIYQIVIARSAFVAMVQGEETTGFFILHSSASQRAEAFLRTLGKWVD